MTYKRTYRWHISKERLQELKKERTERMLAGKQAAKERREQERLNTSSPTKEDV